MIWLSKIIDYFLEHRVLLHLLYWVAALVLYCVFGLGYGQPLIVSFYLRFIFLPFQIIATYIFIYYQLPLLIKKKYIFFAISFVVLSYFYYLGVHINYDMGIGTRISSWHKPHNMWSILTNLELYFIYMVDIYVVVFVTAAIKFIKDHLASRQILATLAAEKTKAEYNVIRAKVQPEFVLRSLQLITQISKTDIQLAPQLIADLSEVLDDAIYQSRQLTRSLSDEVEKLSNYINLYSKSSPVIGKTTFDSNALSSILKISTMTLTKIIANIFDRLSRKYASNTFDCDTTVVEDNGKCILQIKINSHVDDISIDMTEFGIDIQERIKGLMDINYQNRNQIDIMCDNKNIDFQFIIDL